MQEMMENKKELNPIDLDILAFIPKKKPTFKDDIVDTKLLSARFSISKREVAYSIARLRKYYPVCSDKGISGYWLGSAKDLTTTINQILNSIKSMEETVKNLTAVLISQLEAENV